MIRVNIEYHVLNKKGRSFRPVEDIVNDVEREMLENAFFAEASYYQITVVNAAEQAVIERKEEKI